MKERGEGEKKAVNKIGDAERRVRDSRQEGRKREKKRWREGTSLAPVQG